MWAHHGIFRFQFVKPLECDYLSEESKEEFLSELDFGDDDRVKTLLLKTNNLHDDVSLKMNLQHNYFLRVLLTFQDELDYAICGLAVLINFILVISLEKGYYRGSEQPVYEPEVECRK